MSKATAVKEIRDQLLEELGNICPACTIEYDEKRPAVVDHDHKTGKVRGLLCHWCNFQEGKVRRACVSASGPLSGDLTGWLENLLNYLKNSNTDIDYPNHKTKKKVIKKTSFKKLNRLYLRKHPGRDNLKPPSGYKLTARYKKLFLEYGFDLEQVVLK